MAETLGSLCDKMTIIKPKEWHSKNQPERMRSLATQEQQLREEIDASIADAASGRIPVERLTFAANKVYRKEGNVVPEVTGNPGPSNTNPCTWSIEPPVESVAHPR
jgi:hypothetical protein